MTGGKVKSKATASNSTFAEDDRMLLNEVNSTIKTLVGEIQMLKDELRINKEKLKQVTSENNQLKQLVNLNHLKIDRLEQYDRRENFQIYNVPETTAKKDDGLEELLNVAHELKIDLNEKFNKFTVLELKRSLHVNRD